MGIIDPENQLLFFVSFAVFVLAVLFELHLRAKKQRKARHEKPHSKRIDQALEHIKEKGIEKITNDIWEEATGVSHATAARDLNHLVELGILEKKGRGRGVHYIKTTKK